MKWVKASEKTPISYTGDLSLKFEGKRLSGYCDSSGGKEYTTWHYSNGDRIPEYIIPSLFWLDETPLPVNQEGKIRKALQELVDLKDLSNKYGKTGDYELRKPAAWVNARAALSHSQPLPSAVSVEEPKTDDSLINHIRNVKLLQAIHCKKKLFVECMATDIGAKEFPNTNFAVKEIELPNFELYEEKMGYKWVATSPLPSKEDEVKKVAVAFALWAMVEWKLEKSGYVNDSLKLMFPSIASVAEYWFEYIHNNQQGV